jgi:2-oxoglutarate ferredoxin oxidoreductase subunit beta
MSATLTAKDFTTSQEVRWCPGCGDYAILKTVTKTLAEIGARPETTAFISGIGCAARFPYYVESYGFHTIHGRAPAIATGLKLVNPELDVWVVTGDGDALSIGGNHLLHALRRNVGLKILLFNNEIYGLTKGQYSPTSRVGTRSPSTPGGSIDAPLSPGSFALGAGARFFARAIDTDKVGLSEVLKEVHAFDGAALTEIFQNCIVYNEDVFASFTDRKTAADTQLRLKHGEAMLFGADNDKGIHFNSETFSLEIVDAKARPEQVLRHDETNKVLANLLIELQAPMALGVIYKNPGESFEKAWYGSRKNGLTRTGTVNDALRSSNTWTVT